MKVSVRSVKGKGLSIKKLGKDRQSHTAGTVIMKGVRFGKTILGEVVEEHEKQIRPRAEGGLFTLAVSQWNRARYIGSLGGYYNQEGKKVESAAYVYAVGSTIYYTD